MDNILLDYLASPQTHEKLSISRNKLISENKEEYRIVRNVPILLPDEVKALWLRELIEVLLWEYPQEREKILEELENAVVYNDVYIKYIQKLLKNKQGILNAVEDYSKQNTEKWVAQNSDKTVTLTQKLEFAKYSRKSIGRKRTETKINAKGIFEVYPHFGKTVNKNSPSVIVELGTGAGGGTAAAALAMRDSSILFTVDIGFECLGNAIGIAKYQKKNIVPVCANFWYLPFADCCIDAVCTYNGLDESRETERTVSEVSRILKQGGTFTVVSRKNSSMRQAAVLRPFGFTDEEIVCIMKKCRLYSDIDTLDEICLKHNFRLNTRKEFVRNENLTSVLSEYVKE